LLSDSWTGSTQETVDVTLVGRYYERFGDHGVSVARRVVYLVTGDFADERGPAAASA
jgi:phosphate transport system protein